MSKEVRCVIQVRDGCAGKTCRENINQPKSPPRGLCCCAQCAHATSVGRQMF